ncbi:unnamed protein product [Nippostrongylus brasiliensis]|uniref:AzlC family protein n=1 Tax=Nippostrongylus brasiliensis TaxID=27835 RepID=A0A158QXS9_NIPBR|nr:unnamed protein product [Nippostrongylus brasiliensis]
MKMNIFSNQPMVSRRFCEALCHSTSMYNSALCKFKTRKYSWRYLSKVERRTLIHNAIGQMHFVYAIPANCVLIGALSLLLPIGPLSAAMMLDAFLLAMAAIGITGRAAVLIVPNIAIKAVFLCMVQNRIWQ